MSIKEGLMNFKNKVAIITGASRGIGRATALAMAKRGADILVNYYRSDQAAHEVADEITAMGRKAIAVHADIGDPHDIDLMFQEFDEHFDRLDVLVNNAGDAHLIPLENLTVDIWDDIMSLDLRGPFLCAKAAAKRMVPRKYGRIVNISSIAMTRGMEDDPAYAAAKSGMHGFTKSIARYLGKHNITVNTVAPGPIDTELAKKIPDEIRKAVAASSPLGKEGTPEDVADAILFFASDLSRHVTGQYILVDGGLEMP